MSDIPKSVNDQFSILVEKELNIDIDEIDVKLFLEKNNYYRFRGYFIDFLVNDIETGKEIFKKGTRFSYLRDLYLCDSEMRLSISRIIESVELYLKSIYALHMSNSLNNAYFFYDDNYFFEMNGKRKINTVRNNLNDYINKNSKSPIIKRYTDTHTNISTLPIWAIVELISFGDISILYENTLKKYILDLNKEYFLFSNRNLNLLISWIRSTCKLRNTCHHYDRLYKNHFLETPPAITYNSQLNADCLIDQNQQQTLFYNVLVSSMICPTPEIIDTSLSFFKDLQIKYDTIDFKIAYGFPSNWEYLLKQYSCYFVNSI